MEPKNITEIIRMASDKEFEQAVNTTKELLDKKILTINLTTPDTLGIDLLFKEEQLEPVIKKSSFTIEKYKEIFGDEISEMIIATTSNTMKIWLHSKVEHEFSDELKNKADKKAARQLFQQRCKMVEENLIDSTLQETVLLRETTKNRILSDVKWEINRKMFVGQKSNEISLPPFATLQFFFVDKDRGPILTIDGGGLRPVEAGKKMLVDLNLQDVDLLIQRLTEIKNKLDELITKGN